MSACPDPECHLNLQRISKCVDNLKPKLDAKADKVPLGNKLTIIAICVTILIFIIGTPVMYGINKSNEATKERNENSKRIQAYSIKQDVILEAVNELKSQLKEHKQANEDRTKRIFQLLREIRDGNK